jgi:thiamine phosphate synthase YjbQ (UPF0047 family)
MILSLKFRGINVKLKIETTKHIELIDITSEVQQQVMKSKISEGIRIF